MVFVDVVAVPSVSGKFGKTKFDKINPIAGTIAAGSERNKEKTKTDRDFI